VFKALEGPLLPQVLGRLGAQVDFTVSAVAYPDDAFSPETVLEACAEGVERARAGGTRYYQVPAPAPEEEEEEILDSARVGLFSEPVLAPSRLLRLFARLCLDTVPAERVSIMVPEGEELVIQVAFGFEGQEEVVRTSRIPLNRRTVSAWVAHEREPLLVTGADDFKSLPVNQRDTYRGDSFISYPLLNGEELVGVIHFSNRSDGGAFTPEDVDRFTPLARVVSQYLALGQQFDEVQEQFLQDSLFALVDLMESQVPGMERHSREVARLAEATARQLGYGSQELEKIRVSSRLHDLGKVNYRARVLSEPRALSPREMALTQRHPLLGWKFLEEVPLHRIDRDAILYHHEREDGSGYLHKPGGEIPSTAKILAAADVFQALTSDRPYRPAIPKDQALAYLENNKGSLFDALVVDALKSAVREELIS
jgi:HD-GYP domain-containing protein (c-di-GMP phosphodiesterase class II)